MAEKYFCYCIGGTGARIAEVAAHLCAMNLIKDEHEITFIVVDKDQACGGTTQANEVITRTSYISQIKGPKVGKQICKSWLSKPNNAWDFTNALNTITNGNGNESLKNALGQAQTDDDILFNAFYSENDQTTRTTEGFYGHPTIGALMFQYMMKNQNGTNIAQPVLKCFGDGDTAKVFIIGSVFGGTGASVFSNLAAHIRRSVMAQVNNGGDGNANTLAQNETQRRNGLIISGVLLLPYFSFDNNRDGGRIDYNEFYAKSKTALEQYAMDENFIRSDVDSDNSFDTLYICGQNPLHKVGEYSEGGESQKNHFDLVDLIAAYAMVSFFNEDFMQANAQNEINDSKIGKIYEYDLNTNMNQQLSRVLSTHLPQDLASNLKKMLLFSAFVLFKIWVPYKLHGGNILTDTSTDVCANIRMIGFTYDKKELGIIRAKAKDAQRNRNDISDAIDSEAATALRNLYHYCRDYIRFANDIASNGHNWTQDGANGDENSYDILDKEHMRLITDLCTAIDKENTGEMKKRGDAILNIDFAGNGKTIGRVENNLQNFFANVKADYIKKQTAAAERFGDYVNKAFVECFE